MMEDHRPTLYLICGLPGAGKTTLARRLESERQALRLCPDEWIADLLADPSDRTELDRLRDPVEAIQWRVAQRALVLGVDVVLENGFWSRAERDYYRNEAEKLDAHVVLIYLEVEREELWARLRRRNRALPPATFPVSREELDTWVEQFEAPTPDELGPTQSTES